MKDELIIYQTKVSESNVLDDSTNLQLFYEGDLDTILMAVNLSVFATFFKLMEDNDTLQTVTEKSYFLYALLMGLYHDLSRIALAKLLEHFGQEALVDILQASTAAIKAATVFNETNNMTKH